MATPIVPAPIATSDTQHVCFICLQTDADTPEGPWVNPCPCSLEAHEGCMLRWVAETEHNAARAKGGLRCPACRARIYIDEPYDALVALHNKLQRGYSKVSPIILGTLFTSGTVIGLSWYGWNALNLFAGPDMAYRWVGVGSLLNGGRRRGPFSRVVVGSMVKMLELALVGPALIVLWAVPGVGGFSFVPPSLIVSLPLLAYVTARCSICQP